MDVPAFIMLDYAYFAARPIAANSGRSRRSGGEGRRHMEIQPKALAIELMRIIAAKNGHRMRIMALKIFLLRKGAPFSVTS